MLLTVLKYVLCYFAVNACLFLLMAPVLCVGIWLTTRDTGTPEPPMTPEEIRQYNYRNGPLQGYDWM